MLTTLKTWIAGVALAGAFTLSGSLLAASTTTYGAAPAPQLSFPCSAIPPHGAHPVVTCWLAGRGFAHHEALTITYRVEIQWMQGPQQRNQRWVTTYRRHAASDGQGAFRRPAFWFAVPTGPDVQVWKIWVQVQVIGAHGERATTATGGGAD